jgi:hypothetical protein
MAAIPKLLKCYDCDQTFTREEVFGAMEDLVPGYCQHRSVASHTGTYRYYEVSILSGNRNCRNSQSYFRGPYFSAAQGSQFHLRMKSTADLQRFENSSLLKNKSDFFEKFEYFAGF